MHDDESGAGLVAAGSLAGVCDMTSPTPIAELGARAKAAARLLATAPTSAKDAALLAAADLLVEGGFDAVRHRAVATRAGLPLASTTYYFESLDDLIALPTADELRRGAPDLFVTSHP